MKFDAFEADNRAKDPAPCVPCEKPPMRVGDTVLITNKDGKAEYRVLTQDGRLIPADSFYNFGG